VDREKLDRWCEWGILALILGMLVYAPLAFGATRPLDLAVLLGICSTVLLLWGIRFWTRVNYRILWAPVCWTVLAFLGYAVYCYLHSRVEYAARMDLLKILVYGVVFFATLDNLNKQEWVQAIVFTLVAVAVCISFYAVYQFITGSKWIYNVPQPAGYYGRASGTYICPNHLSGFLELVLPLALAFSVTSRLKPLYKVLLGYSALVMAAGIAVTISRGGWAMTSIGMLAFFGILLFNRAYRLPAIIFLVLLIAGGGLFANRSLISQRRIGQTRDMKGNYGDGRLFYWKPALLIWREHFWTGGGLNHFDFLYREHRNEVSQGRPVRAHNDYLNTLADMGIIGFTLVLACWTLLLLGILRTWRFVNRVNDISTKPSNRFAFVFGASISLLIILLHSATDFNMHIPANALVTVTLFALLTGHLRFATERFWVGPRLIGRVVAMMPIAAGIFYFSEKGTRLWQEDRLERRADSYHLADSEQIEFRKLAYKVEPMNYETTFWIGQAYRVRSVEGDLGYEKLAQEAMDWFSKGIALNPYEGNNYLYYGMCLHWLKRPIEASEYFKKGQAVDPASAFTYAMLGWHYFQLHQYEKAQQWFLKSIWKIPDNNDIARVYLKIVAQKLALPPNLR
jgi:O-antigen ligase